MKVHEIHWWEIKEAGESMEGVESLGLDKRRNGETHFFYIRGTGQLIINIHSTQRWYAGNKVTVRVLWPYALVVLCSGAGACAFEEKEITLTVQVYAKEEWRGLT